MGGSRRAQTIASLLERLQQEEAVEDIALSTFSLRLLPYHRQTGSYGEDSSKGRVADNPLGTGLLAHILSAMNAGRGRRTLFRLLCAFILVSCLGIICWAALARATDGKPVHNIELTETRDIADAAAVNAAISVLFKDAESCPAATSKDRQACGCSFKDDLKKLKSAYDDAVAKHPGWNEVDTVVAYRNTAKGTSVILSFPGIKRQLNACAQHQQ